ncbi:hypothetical protein BB561_003727 [Smittium simulii]|uniref:Uncharacterized protein n=1 Tax=Smittium simulii TaxID=133385 RepID=A0A2T9YJS1_9FUNG|nr:hypothetical protein BB561_003727 [Smittium simulii]
MQAQGTRQKQILISEFRPMMKGFDCQFIVLEANTPLMVRDGQTVQKFKVADSSGSIVCTLWGEYEQHIKCGDILRIEGAEAKLFKNTLTVTVGRYGKLVKVGEHTMEFSEVPFYSEFLWVPDSVDSAKAG